MRYFFSSVPVYRQLPKGVHSEVRAPKTPGGDRTGQVAPSLTTCTCLVINYQYKLFALISIVFFLSTGTQLGADCNTVVYILFEEWVDIYP
jgi:hypothetical protein